MFVRSLVNSCGKLMGIGLLSLLVPSQGKAGMIPLPVASPGPVSVVEAPGTPDFQLTFTVTNSTPITLVLDYALATIHVVNGDSSDAATFSGQNGANGLVSAPLFILPGGVGNFTYSFQVPQKNDAPFDVGDNLVTFNVEMSPYAGGLGNIPPPLTLPAAAGLIFWNLGIPGSTVNPAVAIQLLSNLNVPPPNPFPNVPNQPLLIGPPNVYTGKGFDHVYVSDTPEPDSLTLLGIGSFGLLGYGWRRWKQAPI